MDAAVSQESDGPERRVAPRMRMLKRAKIVFNRQFSTYDCVLRNLSATGALLMLDETAQIPEMFELKIGDEPLRPARSVYRRGMLLGIRFLDVPAEDDDTPAPVRQEPADARAADAHVEPQSTLPDEEATSCPGRLNRIVPEILPVAVTRNFRWN